MEISIIWRKPKSVWYPGIEGLFFDGTLYLKYSSVLMIKFEKVRSHYELLNIKLLFWVKTLQYFHIRKRTKSPLTQSNHSLTEGSIVYSFFPCT